MSTVPTRTARLVGLLLASSLGASVALGSSPLDTLDELVGKSDRVVRGQVVSSTVDTATLQCSDVGLQLSRVRVTDALKGEDGEVLVATTVHLTAEQQAHTYREPPPMPGFSETWVSCVGSDPHLPLPADEELLLVLRASPSSALADRGAHFLVSADRGGFVLRDGQVLALDDGSPVQWTGLLRSERTGPVASADLLRWVAELVAASGSEPSEEGK